MSPRRSKAERRRISYRIHAARSEQPGYSEIIKEHEELKQRISDALARKRGENYKKIRALLTNNWWAALSDKFIDISDPIVEFSGDHPFFSIVVFCGALVVDWKIAVSLLASFALVRYLSDLALRKQRHAYAKEIDAIRSDESAVEQKLKKGLADHFTKKCDEFNGYPPDWQERRLRVFRRDDYTCQTCSRILPKQKLHAHHLLEISCGGTNQLDNLITLCARCHAKEHHSPGCL